MSEAQSDIRRAVREELARNDFPGPTTGPEIGIFNLVVRIAGNMLEEARGAAADYAATAGAQVAREQAADRTDYRVPGVTMHSGFPIKSVDTPPSDPAGQAAFDNLNRAIRDRGNQS